MIAKAMCSENVWRGPALFTPCERTAKIERDGKPYCRQHDPEAVKQREDARRQRWQQESADSTAQAQRNHAARVARDCIIQIAYEMREPDKRLVKAFAVLIGNSDWQPPAPPAAQEDEGNE